MLHYFELIHLTATQNKCTAQKGQATFQGDQIGIVLHCVLERLNGQRFHEKFVTLASAEVAIQEVGTGAVDGLGESSKPLHNGLFHIGNKCNISFSKSFDRLLTCIILNKDQVWLDLVDLFHYNLNE